MNTENEKVLTQEEKQKIINEYEQKMKMVRKEFKTQEMQKRREVIESLTDSELELVVSLYKTQIKDICKRNQKNKEIEK